MQVPDYQLPKPVLDTKWVKDQKKLKLSENQQKAIQRVQEVNSKHKQKLIEQEQKEKKEYREHMKKERKKYLECMRKGRPYTAKVFTKSQQSKQYDSKYAQSRIQKLIQERNQLKQKNEEKIKKLCFIEPKLQQKNKEIGFQILNGFGSDIYFGVTSQAELFKQHNFQLENKNMEDFIKNYRKLEGFYVFGNGKFYSDGGIIADQDFKIEKNGILKINVDFQSKDLKFEKESTGQFFCFSFDKLGQEQIEKLQFFVIVRKINDQVRFIQNIENYKKLRNYQHVKFQKEFAQALNQEKMKKQQALQLFEKQKNNVENKVGKKQTIQQILEKKKQIDETEEIKKFFEMRAKQKKVDKQPEQAIQKNEQQKSEDKNKEQKEDEQGEKDPKQNQQNENQNVSQKQKQNNQSLKNKYYKELIQQVRSQNEMNENKKEGSDRFGYKITYQFGKEARFKDVKLEDMIKPDSGSYNPLDPKTVRGKLGRDYELDGRAFLSQCQTVKFGKEARDSCGVMYMN